MERPELAATNNLPIDVDALDAYLRKTVEPASTAEKKEDDDDASGQR